MSWRARAVTAAPSLGLLMLKDLIRKKAEHEQPAYSHPEQPAYSHPDQCNDFYEEEHHHEYSRHVDGYSDIDLDEPEDVSDEAEHNDNSFEKEVDQTDGFFDLADNNPEAEELLYNNLSFNEFLAVWIVGKDIPRRACNELLKFLRSKCPKEGIPNDVRTLLGTPRTTKTYVVPPGEYVHFGIIGALTSSSLDFSKYDDNHVFSMRVNTDGATVSVFRKHMLTAF